VDREQLALLKELMALEFTALEFQLYLNTHPNDQRALMEYNSACQAVKAAKERYVSCYGPLSHCEQSGFPWQWISDPWPWEICYE
jgi:spore coat protein JB